MTITMSQKKASEASEGLDSSTECSEIIREDATSTIMSDLAFPETAEMKNIASTHKWSTDFVEKPEKDLLRAELKEKLSAALTNN